MDPIVLLSNSKVEGCKLVDNFTFKNGTTVPVYDLHTTGAFNQLIGHAKFANRNYGNVYYRGVNGLFDNVLPSIMRGKATGNAFHLEKILKKACQNPRCISSLKLRSLDTNTTNDRKKIIRYNNYCVEALMQHYVGNTRFIDVVDNHWVALWMGSHNFVAHGEDKLYYEVHKRIIPVENLCECIKNNTPIDKLYVYVLLMAMPFPESKSEYVISESEEFVEVDLRKSIPSFYLRPHAQHALVIRRKDFDPNTKVKSDYYDMASQVIGIMRIRIDIALGWLGNGQLLTKDNLFPSPSVDCGYNTLLKLSDTFVYPFEIKKYF